MSDEVKKSDGFWMTNFVNKLVPKDILWVITAPFIAFGFILGKIIENGHLYKPGMPFYQFIVVVSRFTIGGATLVLLALYAFTLMFIFVVPAVEVAKKAWTAKSCFKRILLWVCTFGLVIGLICGTILGAWTLNNLDNGVNASLKGFGLM